MRSLRTMLELSSIRSNENSNRSWHTGSSSGSWMSAMKGCARACSTVIRRSGLKARSPHMKSMASGVARGNTRERSTGAFRGNDNIYLRARSDLMAAMSSSSGDPRKATMS
eukprot:Amastigsp_a1887_57.p6 type:complete len:111 gc:universal Amastigsp_a1887_57:178-510(+)